MRRQRYAIRVEGHLGRSWADWFEGLDIQAERSEGNLGVVTVLSGAMDQAALHGYLIKIRDLGIRLLSVQVIDQTSTGG